MRSMQVLAATVMCAAAANARAEPSPAAGEDLAPAGRRVPVALGTNLPFLWKDADTLAASLYVGVSDHQAIRANIASYKAHGPVVTDAIGGLLFNSDGSESSQGGRTTDVGVGWVYYPRSLWSGLMFEAGALRRARDVSVHDSNRTPERVTTQTTVYAARALIGWSWLVGGHAFVATGVGLSIGRESGTEIFETDYNDMTSRMSVTRVDVAAEAYLRAGAAFDL